MLIYNLDNFASDTTGITDSTTSIYKNNTIVYYLNSVNTNNRFFYQNEIPSNILGFISNTDVYIKDILFLCKNINSDSTIFLYNDNDLISELIILKDVKQKWFSDINLLLSNNKQLKIFIKSVEGVDYPLLKINLN